MSAILSILFLPFSYTLKTSIACLLYDRYYKGEGVEVFSKRKLSGIYNLEIRPTPVQ